LEMVKATVFRNETMKARLCRAAAGQANARLTRRV